MPSEERQVAEYVVAHEDLGWHPGKVHRYKVTGYWGNVPDQIKALLDAEDGYCVDYWRGQHTSWEIYDDEDGIVGSWGGEYVGLSPAALHNDGEA